MLHVALLEPEIAPNAGSAARTCLAGGARLHLVRPLGFTLHDRTLRRAGMDYWDASDVRVHDSYALFVRAFSDAYVHRRVFGLSSHATGSIYQTRFADEDVLLFGSESRGLPHVVLEEVEPRRIPMAPSARSLNLAVAVGVALFEAVRQVDSGARGQRG